VITGNVYDAGVTSSVIGLDGKQLSEMDGQFNLLNRISLNGSLLASYQGSSWYTT
jgi:hypothetical protein